MTLSRQRLKQGLSLLLLTFLSLGVVCTRVVLSSRRHFAAAFDLEWDRQIERAILTYGRAARMYTPYNPYSRSALERLRGLAEQSEVENKRAQALLAWREVRSAILAVRSTYTPYREHLEAANQSIAALMALAEEADPELAKEPLAARKAFHQRALLRDEMPRTRYVLVALLGLLVFFLGALGMVYRGVAEDGRLFPGTLLRFGGVTLLGVGLLLFGLWLA